VVYTCDGPRAARVALRLVHKKTDQSCKHKFL